MSTLRLTCMESLALSLSAPLRIASAGLLLFAFASPLARAQQVMGQNGTSFHDTNILVNAEKELPVGHKVALIEFEDLECPACSHAAPIVKTALDHYKIGFERHDFLIQGHVWSKEAAIFARYLQDKVSPDVAEQYRRDVFANQIQIASRDDMQAYTQKWFAAHKVQVPFNLGPDSVYALEVQADCTLGVRLGIRQTPTLIVIGPRGWIEVTDLTQLYTAIEAAQKQAPLATAHDNMKKPTTTGAH